MPYFRDVMQQTHHQEAIFRTLHTTGQKCAFECSISFIFEQIETPYIITRCFQFKLFSFNNHSFLRLTSLVCFRLIKVRKFNEIWLD